MIDGEDTAAPSTKPAFVHTMALSEVYRKSACSRKSFGSSPTWLHGLVTSLEVAASLTRPASSGPRGPVRSPRRRLSTNLQIESYYAQCDPINPRAWPSALPREGSSASASRGAF